MPRLIDADKARNLKYNCIEHEKAVVHEITNDSLFAYMCGWNEALDSVYKYAMTVDTDPVKHGHWEWHGCTYDLPWKCSECSELNEHDSDYCPNCGAKMDGKIVYF